MKSKRFITTLLVFAMLLVAITGCGGNGNQNASNGSDVADGAMDADQHINTFISMQPNTMDPSKGSDMYGNDIIMNTLEPLIRVDEDEDGNAKYVEAGAESYTISEDGLVYTFKLRDNKWSDGVDVTAKDYEYGIKRTVDPATAAPLASQVFPVLNGEAINNGEVDVEELGVKAIDDKTLEITLGSPLPYFLDLVITRSYMPQRADLVEKFGDQYATAPENTPSCGPFVLDDWIMNSNLELVKNTEFWNAENVKPEKVNIQILSDENTINTALQSGDLDYAAIGDPKWQAQFKDDDNFEYFKRENPWTGYLLFNMNEDSNVSNVKIRKAISVALDRQELIDSTMHGTPVVAYSFVPHTVSIKGEEFNKSGEGPLKELMDEVKDPKALLIEGMKEAGLGEDPSKLNINFQGSGNATQVRLMTEFMKQNLEEKLGIVVDVTDNDWNAFTSKLNAGDFDICWLGWGADFNDPANFLDTLYSKAAVYPSQGFKNDRYDELIEASQSEMDTEKRAEMLREAEKIALYEDVAISPINHAVANIFRRAYVRDAANNYFVTMGYQKIYTEGR